MAGEISDQAREYCDSRYDNKDHLVHWGTAYLAFVAGYKAALNNKTVKAIMGSEDNEQDA